MELRSNDVAVMGVKILLSKEECVGSMGQRSNSAAVTDAQTTLNEEEFVSSMGRY
jgi:hypothetical protein